jgi:hypothetical protein
MLLVRKALRLRQICNLMRYQNESDALEWPESLCSVQAGDGGTAPAVLGLLSLLSGYW